ncbi:hypothetical protein FEM03_08980 [Phragmitibacter flavus]|uniref:Trimeric autotransporter adhesin YadA-like head domain-containing protein n=1 Tax=Phragmitibacter flavus TaxID=2576071 RepID=A0A5R8KFI3_9BACT|nr:hypothetical protein [Phragmitibacter flavus]TLD71036.1 hypothetical protein FEM03_08980 [Phragmitibacter flavus]
MKRPVFLVGFTCFSLLGAVPVLSTAQIPQSVNVTKGLTISPVGVQPSAMEISGVQGVGSSSVDTLMMLNRVGDISVILPQANGSFAVGKTVTSGGSVSIFEVIPGAGTDTAILHANTEVNGDLRVSGKLHFSGGGSIWTSPYAGAVTLGGEYGTLASSYRAAAIGGMNALATGMNSIAIGGYIWNNGPRPNLASGTGAAVVGGGGNTASSILTSIFGSYESEITGGDWGRHSVIVGGAMNKIAGGASNAIVGGSGNEMPAWSWGSVILGGSANKMTNSGTAASITGGQSNQIGFANASAIVGGTENKIIGNTYDWQYGDNFIGAGRLNTIGSGVPLSAIVGGYANTISSGAYHTVLGGYSAQITGGYSNVVMGSSTIASGNQQLVMGRYNINDGSKLFIIGNGSADNARRNAFSVGENGDVVTKTMTTESVATGSVATTTMAADSIVTETVQADTISVQSITISNPADTSDISMGPFTQGIP